MLDRGTIVHTPHTQVNKALQVMGPLKIYSSTQPPSEVTEGSLQTVVYAQVDPVKQNGPQPPTNDDPVQYAQIEHQDKL